MLSLPTQGAWIEIGQQPNLHKILNRRSLHRERGLKLILMQKRIKKNESLPTQGAWIEIALWIKAGSYASESLPTQGAWIEIVKKNTVNITTWSLPTQGAWIEIPTEVVDEKLPIVAPYTGSVD